jgi:hypothetical protein
VAGCAPQPLDDVTFGLLVHRSADQLVVYDGQIHRREMGPAAAFAGEFALDLSLVANLTRGHYSVTLYVYDNPTRRHLIRMRRIAGVTVTEDRARIGIAHLDMTATLDSSVSQVAESVG